LVEVPLQDTVSVGAMERVVEKHARELRERREPFGHETHWAPAASHARQEADTAAAQQRCATHREELHWVLSVHGPPLLYLARHVVVAFARK
jgi:hypothetical protein